MANNKLNGYLEVGQVKDTFYQPIVARSWVSVGPPCWGFQFFVWLWQLHYDLLHEVVDRVIGSFLKFYGKKKEIDFY